MNELKRADERPFPVGGVLVLGSDWGGTEGYCKEKERLRNGASLSALGPTWKNLEKLFKEPVNLVRSDEIFLTNAWPCLRKGKSTGGTPPGAQDPEFTKRCKEFFLYTFKEMQPRLVLPLGIWPTAFVASCFGNQPRSWLRPGRPFSISTWKEVDKEPYARLGGSVVVPMVHTSMPNWRHVPRFKDIMNEEVYFKNLAALIAKALGSDGYRPNGDGAIGAQIVVARLRQALRRIEPYPNKCCECKKIPGGDFFPGGDGFPRC